MDRVILHCDCNSFFASVETALHPEYRNLPMAVCGSTEERRGIVLAKNELAKRYNVETAETVFSARRKCPNLVIVEPHYDEYAKYSRLVNEIYARYTEQIEPFGIDESWLDVTASRRLFGSGPEIAERIRAEVREELGITVSIGVSFNKVFAKLGSDYKKPDAVTVISRENFREIVYPLPVGDLLFVGRKTAEALRSLGIRTIGELAAASESLMSARFGRMGAMLLEYARGLDTSPVSPPTDNRQKSVSNGFTFRHDLVTPEEIRIGVDYLCEEIGVRLRSMDMKCSTVSVTIKDEHLNFIQRQRPVQSPTDISSEIADVAYAIIKDSWAAGRPIRMISVSAANLTIGSSISEQIGFFEDSKKDKREKAKKREIAIDNIKQKHGKASITKASFMDSDIGISKKGKNGNE